MNREEEVVKKPVAAAIEKNERSKVPQLSSGYGYQFLINGSSTVVRMKMDLYLNSNLVHIKRSFGHFRGTRELFHFTNLKKSQTALLFLLGMIHPNSIFTSL